MFTIRRTTIFIDWLKSLKDRRAVARIAVRIDRFEAGNPGQVRDVGEGVSEMKIDYGPGYRVYYIRRDKVVYLLLCGGDKSTQSRDIAEAKRIAKEWRDENAED
ncbi:type II toxin-antitoxin system RelE/ParE family toxin [Taklimakanibacter deserti]|uniref:type II toxin-antitoxin system RelE/ParE family toxin n=1 Tax=Taklimakanibacter deserti TaxID=2267839 RepID=UPI000E65381E